MGFTWSPALGIHMESLLSPRFCFRIWALMLRAMIGVGLGYENPITFIIYGVLELGQDVESRI